MRKFRVYIIAVLCLMMQFSVHAKNPWPASSEQSFQFNFTRPYADTFLLKVNSFEVQKTKRWRHYRKGDTLYYCDVLKLRNLNYKEHVFAVFGYAIINARKSRSKIKIKYILKREANYLSTIFYTKAVRLERKRIDKSYQVYMKFLEKKYPSIMMWGVLDANAIGNVITRH